MSPNIIFRAPSTHNANPSSLVAFEPPSDNQFFGEWYMIRTSNSHWRDKKNVRMSYTPSHSDKFIAQYKQNSAITEILGSNIPAQEEVAVFHWQMKGLLRFFGAKWEILAWKESEDGRSAWMITYAHKTIFTAEGIDIACKPKGGISDIDMKAINSILLGVKSKRFQGIVESMYDVEQES